MATTFRRKYETLFTHKTFFYCLLTSPIHPNPRCPLVYIPIEALLRDQDISIQWLFGAHYIYKKQSAIRLGNVITYNYKKHPYYYMLIKFKDKLPLLKIWPDPRAKLPLLLSVSMCFHQPRLPRFVEYHQYSSPCSKRELKVYLYN